MQTNSVAINNATTGKLWSTYINSNCPQRWSEDEILQTISREKPRPTGQYFSSPKRWSFKRQCSPCNMTWNGLCWVQEVVTGFRRLVWNLAWMEDAEFVEAWRGNRPQLGGGAFVGHRTRSWCGMEVSLLTWNEQHRCRGRWIGNAAESAFSVKS